MPDYSQTRSEYLKAMMGDRDNALAPYRPEQVNDIGGASFDFASLSDEDINSALKQMAGTQYEGSQPYQLLQAEQQERAKKAEEQKKPKSWFEQVGDFFSNIGTAITEGVLNVVDSVWDFSVGATAGLFGGGWFGAQNDFTDWAAQAMTDDRWVTVATKGLTQLDVFDKGTWTNEGGYWDNWSYENIAAEQARDYEGMDWLHKGGNFVGELIPSLVLAYFTGGASLGAQAAIQGGLGFARAYGNAASQALNEGASFQQSAGYGALSGSVEAAFSAGSVAVGGMLASKGSQGVVKTISQKFGQTIGQKFGEGASVAAGKAMEIVLDALGEATEETVENALDPAFRMIYDQDAWYNAYGTAENRKAYMQEMAKAALMAAAGSIIAGGVKEGIEIGKLGKKGYIAQYQSEIETSENFRRLKQESKARGDNLAGEYVQAMNRYRALEQEEDSFKAEIERMAKRGASTDELNAKVAEHQKAMATKLADWTARYSEVYEKASRILNNQPRVIESEPIPEKVEQEGGNAVKDIPLQVVTNPEGEQRQVFAPTFDTSEDFTAKLAEIKNNPDAETKAVKLPISDKITTDEVVVDMDTLSSSEVGKIANIKPDDIQTSEGGDTKFYPISDSKILVFNGDTGVVEATPSADGTRMVYKVNGEEFVVPGMVKAPKQEVEGKYGKDAKKANPSMVIEIAEGKKGDVFSYTNSKRMVGEIDRVIRDMFDDNSLPDAFREKYRTLLGREDLAKEVFTQANLNSESDVSLIRNYVESEILDSEVKVTLDGKNETYSIRDMLTTDEQALLTSKINEAFDEFIANGRTSKYTKLVQEYEATIQRLLGENAEVRQRAKIAATTAKDFNSLANKLGLQGKPSQVKSIIGNASEGDVQVIDAFRGLVKDSKISSRTGLSTSPVAANRIVEWGKGYTMDKYGNSYLWDDAIKMELNALEALGYDYHIKGKEETYHGFHPNTELDIETQTHIDNLLKAINHKLNEETHRIYTQRQEIAGDSVSLYSVTKPAKRAPIISGAIDRAESFASYAANYIGKENPAYDALVTDWTKANGTKLSYQQKYTNASNKILEAEHFDPKKGLSFLNKKVEFQGEKITKGEAASIYFSALTKQGIADGDNTLELFNKKTDSYSKTFKLNGKSDLEVLKGLFTKSELKVMERLQKEVLGGTMRDDFVSWFKKKYGYTPETSDDYFMLNASSEKSEISAEKGMTGAGMLVGNTWGRARGRQDYKGAYRIEDFRTQFAQYGNDLAHYIGYSDYIDKARIILETKVEVDGKGKLSLNDLLAKNAPNWARNEKVGGKTWKRYFEYIATDSKGYDSGSGMDGLVGWAMRAGQTSVLGLNPRSMAKQWLSDFTVMGDVGIGTYLKSKQRVPYNLAHYKQIRDFMVDAQNRVGTDPSFKEYEPYFAIIRERLQNKGAIKGELSSDVVSKVSDITLRGMAFFDEANNVINVWAVAETLAHDFDGLKYGTDANKLQAMKYFTDLVFKTQSNNNAMYVSQLRSGYAGPIRRLLFGLFASDNQNKLQQFDAITREFYYANKRKGEYQKIIDNVNSTSQQIEAAQKAIAYIDKNYSTEMRIKKSSGVVAGLALSGLGAALINETFDRILAKKDKEGKVKKLADGLDWATIMSEAPLEAFLNWIPYVGTFANAVENNTDVSLLTTDRINDIKDGATKLIEALQSGDSSKIGKAVTNFVMTYGELAGLPLNNIYKYTKGIIRNVSETAYLKTFAWMDGLKSNNISDSYKSLIAKNDISGAVEALGINYSLYKTGNADRETLLEISKLSKEGYNAIAKNIPDYIQDEEGVRRTLSEDQKAKFGKSYSLANEKVRKLIRSSGYKAMTSENKAKAIKKVYDTYYEVAKYKTFATEPESRIGKLLAFTGGDYDIANALLLIQKNSELVDTKRMSKKEQAIRLVNQQSMTRAQKLLTLYLMGYGVTAENKKFVQNYLISLGFTKQQAEDFLPGNK